MKYKVQITDRATGESHLYDMGPILWHDSSHFWHTLGNFGCDCNRGMEFDRAKGVPESEVERKAEAGLYPCNVEENRFAVPFAILEDGRKIAIDEE